MVTLELHEAADIRVRSVTVTDDQLTVGLMDGRAISAPLFWYPRLAQATPAQRLRWEIAAAASAFTGRTRMRISPPKVCSLVPRHRAYGLTAVIEAVEQ